MRLAFARLALAALASFFATGGAAHAQDWVTYTDETSTRIVADPSLGDADPKEKDLISGDVDRDGDVDMVVVRKERFSTPGGLQNVLFLNESGVMTDRTADLIPEFLDSTDDRDVALVDVDGDGWLDLVTVTTFAHQPRVYMNLGEDAGGWLGFDWAAADNRIPPFSPAPKFCAIGFGDVDGDGSPDLFFVDYDNSLEDRLLINDGDGFFTDQTSARMTPAMSESVFGTDAHIVDMNGDGFNDIVKNSASGNFPPPGSTPPAVRILYNDGTGDFDFQDEVYTDKPYMVEVADFNKDGRYDLFVVDDDQDSYLINTGNDLDGHAVFTETLLAGSPATEGFGGNTKFSDLDNDGVLDLLVADVDTDLPGCNRRSVALQAQGAVPAVTYTDPFNGSTRSWLPAGVFDFATFDVNDDGILDIWAGTCAGNRLFLGAGNPLLDPEIFSDSFDVPGDLGAWSAVRTDGGDLAVTAEAALFGAAGLELVIDDAERLWVRDDTPDQELVYRARFYLDPNGLAMDPNKRHKIAHGLSDESPNRIFTLVFRGDGAGGYFLRAKVKDDADNWTRTPWVSIPDAPTAIEIAWVKARQPGFRDGRFRLWVDGVEAASLTNLENHRRHLDSLRLGVVGGLDPGTSGTVYLDELSSSRRDALGTLP